MNIRSRKWAKRDRKPWEPIEDDVITELWIYVPASERDEIGISKLLERTIESCRVRAEHLRKDLGIDSPIVKVTITTTTTYIGAFDDPEDRWWEGPKND